MNQLTKFLVEGILGEEKKEIVALYAGGFKPPTAGHFLVVEETLKQYPEIDKLIVLVGSGVRDGIEQAESLLVWEIYQNYLPMKVEIQAPKKPPINAVYSYAKDNPEETIYWVLGAREGKDEDLSDIIKRTAAIDKKQDKYNNVEVKIITTADKSISGTNARKALQNGDQETFFRFVPTQVKEKEEIFNILRPAVTETSNPNDGKAAPFGSGYDEVKEQINEHSMGNSIDILPKIGELTLYMIDNGMNVEPLPTLEIIEDDTTNAEDFFGKTAYYDPYKKHIVLYTHGRHPKDIVRSYAHEMIHHIQNLEGRLGDITTTNTQEDDHLNDIEAEANLKGTMTFRNWTDSLNEAKKGANNSMVAVLSKNGHQISLYDFDNKEPLGLINTYGNEVTGVAAKKGYGPLMYELGMANVYPNGLQSDRNGNTEPEAEAVLNKFIEGASPNIKAVKLTPKDKEYRTEYPNGNEIWDVDGFYNYKFYNADASTLKQLLQKGNELSPNEQSNIISSTEEMYDSMVNEDADSLQEGFDKKLGKDPFGLEQFARELMTEGAYDSLVTQLTKATINKWVADSKKKPLPKKSFVDIDIDDVDGKGREIEFNYVGQVEFDKNVDGYEVDGTSNSGEEEDKFPFIATLFKINPKILPQAWSKISADVSDVIRHEIEHITQAGDNTRTGKYMDDDIQIRDMINKVKVLPQSDYYKLEKEVDAMLQGLYLKAKKTKKPFADVVDNYLNIAPGIETKEDKEAILNLWRSRRKALSLPVFENEEKVMDYKIYLDMDGVLVDFDQQFKDLTGMMPREFEAKHGSTGFWEAIDKAGVGFWRGMSWMPGGEALYNRASQFDHELLSSPSRSELSKIGKRLWRRDKTPSTKLTLSRSYLKKNYAAPNHILIDDREDNIQQWRDAGGIGILYKSAEQVNAELDKLGL
jgi:hypothetical protein